MSRIVLALPVALLCHLLLFLLPLPHNVATPQIMGEKGIEIRLQVQQNPAPTPIAKPEPPTSKQIRRESLNQIEKNNTDKTVPIQLKKEAVKKRIRNVPLLPATPQTIQKSPDNSQKRALSHPAITQASALYLHNPKPKYPALAKRRNWQGTVLLAVIVTTEGRAKSVRIHSSSGYTILDKSALHTVRLWGFRPGTKAGKAVEMEVLVPVHFLLND